MISSDEDDPYDFVGMYKKLLKERQNKVVLLDESSENNIIDSNEPDSSASTSSNNLKNMVQGTENNNIQLNELQKKEQNLVVLQDGSSRNIIIDSNEPDFSASTSSNITVASNTRSKSKICTSLAATPVARKIRKTKQNGVKPSNPSLDSNILGPVICIGDFYDGYDTSSLVSSNKSSDSINNDIENKNKKESEAAFALALLNREMNIKVTWEGKRTYRFPFRMFQPIKSIYEHFAKLENIDTTDISLKLHGKLLWPSDTPNSINYKIVDFIDGAIDYCSGILNKPITKAVEQLSDDEINFKIKQQNVKHPMFISMKKTDLMQVLYLKISEKLCVDVDSVILRFDGDKVEAFDTMETLDLDGDECFELYVRDSH